MRNTLSESYIPKEVREVYIIFVGFWASYILGNVLYLSTSSKMDIYIVLFLSIFCIYVSIIGASFFDGFAARNGSLPHYVFAILLWSIMCLFIYFAVSKLQFGNDKPFLLHIWVGVLIYTFRVFATEFCFVVADGLGRKGE